MKPRCSRSLPHVPCPRVVANGVVGRREWMIQTRAPGANLMTAWPHLDRAERERAVPFAGAGAARGSRHAACATPCREPPWRTAALRPGGDLSVALRVHPGRYRQLVDFCVERSVAAPALLRAAADFIEARLGAFADDREVLTHGDLTFTNVIWDGEQARLVDFETSGAAPLDRS